MPNAVLGAKVQLMEMQSVQGLHSWDVHSLVYLVGFGTSSAFVSRRGRLTVSLSRHSLVTAYCCFASDRMTRGQCTATLLTLHQHLKRVSTIGGKQ